MHENASGTSRTALIRLLLILNTVLTVCLLFTGYFLLAQGFYYGNETLSETLRQNLLEHQSREAVTLLTDFWDPSRSQPEENLQKLQTRFSADNTNFRFAFLCKQNIILSNLGVDTMIVDDDILREESASQDADDPSNRRASETIEVAYRIPTLELMQTPAVARIFQGADDLTLVCGISPSLRSRDAFYRADHFVQALQRIRFVLLAVFFLSALTEGWLWSRLCTHAFYDAPDVAMRGVHRTPMYLLLTLFGLSMAVIVYALRPQMQAIYARAMFETTDTIRPDLFAAALLLALLVWMLSILVTSICFRVSKPQWWKQSIFFHAANVPQSERWVFVAAIAEITAFVLLLLPFNVQDARAYLLVDLLFTGGLILLIFFRAKNLSAVFRATHRVSREEHGAVPTRGLHGKTLRHVQNINYLSESAGEQMQRRFVNESFSTELIHSVTRRLRDPLTAVIRTVDQLRSGTLDAAQTHQAVDRINRHSQELKKSIEDLLRIANASAGNTVVDTQPTDANMMVEQIVGEFYDRFRKKELGLLSQTPDASVRILADGACMWIAFESVLDEFLHCAVRGTRVFLSLEREGESAHFRFRGTSRTDRSDADIRPDSLALPTAKVFTDLQNGTFTYSREQDILTVDLSFPLCGAEHE